VRWLGVSVLVACGTSVPTTPYLGDRAYRRSHLEGSLVNPNNGYSQLRLANYAVPGGWDAWPESNPEATPIGVSGAALDLDVDPTDDAALVALGEAAFFSYPVQQLPESALTGDYGAWSVPDHGVGGYVRYARADGSAALAGTCATCHASVVDGALVPGLSNAHFDLGRIVVDGGWIAPAAVDAHLAWGPGRVDVTTDAGVEPVRIPDLRPVRNLTHLQADATVRQLDRDALAIRIETLIITTHGEASRPPRIVSLALAAYLWSLADALPDPAVPEVFSSTCAGCHAPPVLTGGIVAGLGRARWHGRVSIPRSCTRAHTAPLISISLAA